MNDPSHDEAVARTRFLVIGMTRLVGAIFIALGILVLNGNLEWPEIAGYVLLVIGIADTLIIPQILVKKWRSDTE